MKKKYTVIVIHPGMEKFTKEIICDSVSASPTNYYEFKNTPQGIIETVAAYPIKYTIIEKIEKYMPINSKSTLTEGDVNPRDKVRFIGNASDYPYLDDVLSGDCGEIEEIGTFNDRTSVKVYFEEMDCSTYLWLDDLELI